jgi:hypothetical protein
LDLSFLVIPITFFSGFLIGWKIRGAAGLALSAAAGSAAYVLGLIVLVGPAAVFTFDVFTQMLMVAFGALTSTFGWIVGANYEYLRPKKK